MGERNAYPSFGVLEQIPVGEKKQHYGWCLCCIGGLIWSRKAAHGALTTGKKVGGSCGKGDPDGKAMKEQQKGRRKTNL